MDSMDMPALPTGCRILLKTIVGSRLHGTDTPQSDVDERVLFLLPTSVILSIRADCPKSVKTPGRDANAWELGHFINLCLKGSPTTLEVLLAPPEVSTPEADELRTLFPHLLCKPAVFGAFWGFAQSQRATMLSPTSTRTFKSAAHYLRVVFNGIELLKTGTMTARIVDTPIGSQVLAAKQGLISFDEVLAIGAELERQMEEAKRVSSLPEKPNLEALNEFLLRVRKQNW